MKFPNQALFAAWIFSAACLAAGCAPKTGDQRASGLPGEAAAGQSSAPTVTVKTPYHATIVTSKGNIQLSFLADAAPKSVSNFVDLGVSTKTWIPPAGGASPARPYFEGTIFDRVLPELLIQGGFPASGAGTVSPFEDDAAPNRRFDRPGLVAWASPGPNANGGRFFVTLAPLPWLDGKHVIFAEVTGGLDIARGISKLPADADDRPKEPISIREVRVDYR